MTQQTEAERIAERIEQFAPADNPTALDWQAAAELRRLSAENERLVKCLKKANDQAEHFEREWYLRGQELEALKAQEPVGEIVNERGGVDFISYVPEPGTRLYTAPPRREWVGLTDDDIAETCGFGEYTTTSTRITFTHLSRAIEAKLKEKNG